MQGTPEQQLDRARSEAAGDGYAPPEERPPLASYAALSAAFAAGLGGLLASRGFRDRLPERFDAGDVALLGIASHKISRLVAKDKVTAWARAPFRRYVDQVGPNEMEEETRGEGPRAALGELVGCPYCLGLWIAGALAAGFAAAPRESRFVATIFSGMTVADFMQIAYKAAQDRGLGGE
ncbi:MAG TPA: DUF1360 domain-containing protein [Solirubrobacterales bacterium]|jgi:hypothetical protein|nr:DUF1360 domain-containing protein [Solirubrobacterales bacterium]